jgi:hypothetical protein
VAPVLAPEDLPQAPLEPARVFPGPEHGRPAGPRQGGNPSFRKLISWGPEDGMKCPGPAGKVRKFIYQLGDFRCPDFTGVESNIGLGTLDGDDAPAFLVQNSRPADPSEGSVCLGSDDPQALIFLDLSRP